jgi:hypothetical protein
MTLGLATVCGAADVNWQGANTSSLDAYAKANWLDYDDLNKWYTWKTGYDASIVDQSAVAATTSVDGQNLWSNGGVPGAGDTAIFYWAADRTTFAKLSDGSYAVERNVVINGTFSPDHIVHNSANWQAPATDISVEKDLSTISLTYASGYTTAVKGVFFIRDGYTWTLTGATPFTFSGHQGGWAAFQIAANGKVAFTNSSITFSSFNSYAHPLAGGSGQIEFSNPASSISLPDPNSMTNPLLRAGIGVGTATLRVHENQTWSGTPGTSYIQFSPENYATDAALLQSIGGGRLDNMGDIGLYSNAAGRNSALTLPGGTYGSLRVDSYIHYGNRLVTYKLTDDVELKHGVPLLVTGTPNQVVESDYSLYYGPGSRYSGSEVVLQGNTLTLAKGVLMQKTQTDSTTTTGNLAIDASGAGSVLNIGGDLVYQDVFAAGNNDGTTYTEGRRIGIHGDANSVINLYGNFTTNTRSTLRGKGLYLSTFNLIGGTGGAPNTFEIGADRNDAIADDTYAIGTLNVGSGTESAHILLVNNYLNDGDNTVTDPLVGKSKDNEVLLVGTLNINAGSTLDVGGLGVRVGSATLNIAGDAWLDLNTGLTLSMDQVITTFVGEGDQTAAWAGFQGRVKDSDNPTFTFEPMLDGGNTYWMAIPEPGLTSLLAVGGMLMALRRRHLAADRRGGSRP